MDFIERLVGVSPDNGSGATEFALLMLPLLLALCVRMLARRRSHD